jgi:hypothetical protein
MGLYERKLKRPGFGVLVSVHTTRVVGYIVAG